jgi:hypothetical protein
LEITMKSVFGGLVLAVVLFAAGALSWSEAAATRRVAQAHLRLATLHYDADEDATERPNSLVERLPGMGSLAEDVDRHKATVEYWLARYQSLADPSGANVAGPSPDDPALRLVAANAQFRASSARTLEPKAAVERLDTVIQAYADVLRRDPSLSDAAYNYEFVARLRDTLAREKPATRAAREKKLAAATARPEEVSVDLPAGPTVHGVPGGPPEGVPMSDFKTLSPMRYDEREEQMEPGRGKAIRRKG